jgi:hypothetical protein
MESRAPNRPRYLRCVDLVADKAWSLRLDDAKIAVEFEQWISTALDRRTSVSISGTPWTARVEAVAGGALVVDVDGSRGHVGRVVVARRSRSGTAPWHAIAGEQSREAPPAPWMAVRASNMIDDSTALQILAERLAIAWCERARKEAMTNAAG